MKLQSIVRHCADNIEYLWHVGVEGTHITIENAVWSQFGNFTSHNFSK